MNANGDVVRSEILGSVKMKCYLSGMPELRLGLNDKVMFESTGRSAFPPFLSSLTRSYLIPSSHSSRVLLSLSLKTASRGKSIEMEDVKFHQCVRLARFENDRTISFIPPDGEFELMSYRLSTPVKPLIWVEGTSSFPPPLPPSLFPLLSKVNRGRKDIDALLSPPLLFSSGCGEPSRLKSRVHCQSARAVQEEEYGQQRRDSRAGAGRRRLAQVQGASCTFSISSFLRNLRSSRH